MKRWWQISVAAVIALAVVGYLALRRRPARVETCLRTKLADASGTVDDPLLRAALWLATRERGDFTIDSQNSTQPEAKALSEPKTWNAIAGCRARFVPAAAALRPPRHAVRARVSDRRGKQWVPCRAPKSSPILPGPIAWQTKLVSAPCRSSRVLPRIESNYMPPRPAAARAPSWLARSGS